MDGNNTDIIYLNFNEAFETMSHYRLLLKIKNFGFSKKKKKISKIFFDRYNYESKNW